MHASIWRFNGDSDDLLARYDAMLAEIPMEGMRVQLCLRAPDGIVLIDTCPSRDAFDAFAGSDGFRALRERHGLPAPARVDDYPVHTAVIEGRLVSADPIPTADRR
jgi:hypothetical protein